MSVLREHRGDEPYSIWIYDLCGLQWMCGDRAEGLDRENGYAPLERVEAPLIDDELRRMRSKIAKIARAMCERHGDRLASHAQSITSYGKKAEIRICWQCAQSVPKNQKRRLLDKENNPWSMKS